MSCEEDASWDASAELGELLWCFEELDDLGDFVFRFFDACNILEGDACHFFGHGAVLGFAEGSEHASTTSGAAHGARKEEPDEEQDKQDRSYGVEEEDEGRGWFLDDLAFGEFVDTVGDDLTRDCGDGDAD